MRRKAAWRFGALSGVMAALWLALALFGASSHLHHLLHDDAGTAEHSCVIEHISHGEVLCLPQMDCSTESRPTVVLSLHEVSSFLWSARDFRVALSRGPPSVFTIRTVAG